MVWLRPTALQRGVDFAHRVIAMVADFYYRYTEYSVDVAGRNVGPGPGETESRHVRIKVKRHRMPAFLRRAYDQ